MSRLTDLFKQKKKDVLNVYCTAGYPRLDSAMQIMDALQQHGADIIELGMPYSDPLADGPVIQHSSAIALQNGMTMPVLFSQLKNMRAAIRIPVILMGYMNPVLQYGFENFCRDAAACGVDGFILPDLPIHEFEQTYQPVLKQYGLDFIFLVTPETPDERVRKLDQLSSGFLYAVSSSSTTGQDVVRQSPDQYLRKLAGMGLKNPVLVGFGISNKAGFQSACQHAAGAIIGSAYIKVLEHSDNVNATTKSFLSSVLG